MKTILKSVRANSYELTLCEVSRGKYVVTFGKSVTTHRSFASAVKEFSNRAQWVADNTP